MSGYGRVLNGELKSVYPGGSDMFAFHTSAHDYFRQFVLHPQFACIAGQSAVRTRHYVFCSYPDMDDQAVAEGVCHDLVQYMHEVPFDQPFHTFAACFKSPQILSQMEGVRLFYRFLLKLHAADSEHFSQCQSKDVSSDIKSPKFGFSVGEEAFYLPFFYKFSGSQARQTDYNFVLFNAHTAFSVLREKEAFKPLKTTIRGRLLAAGQTVHPTLADHGDISELPQYTLVDDDERSQEQEEVIRGEILGECPFNSSHKQT